MSTTPLILVTGPMLMGTLMSYFLDGVLVMQLYHYYVNYAATDRRFFVYLVALVCLLDLTHLVVSTHVTYNALAVNFGNPASLAFPSSAGGGIIFMNGYIAFCAHVFYAWRINMMAKDAKGKVAAAFIFATATTAAVGTTVAGVQYSLAEGRGFVEGMKAMKTAVYFWLIGSVASDVGISVTMVSILHSARGMSPWSRSKNVLNALIVNTIENGMITTLCALADLVTYLVLPPDNLIHLCLNGILGRLYAIVLLTSLNGRERTRTRLYGVHEISSTKSSGRHTTNELQLGCFNPESTHATHTTSKSYPVVTVSTDIQIHEDDGMSKVDKMYP